MRKNTNTDQTSYIRAVMEPTPGNILVTKTARYFVIGDSEKPVKQVLFVLHGYGMQAAEFVKQFIPVLEPGTLVIAPEGLSRYYKKGFAGDVVASWMTREDRQFEIVDYINYLNKLYDEIIVDLSVKVYVLGFSQGASTASRWVMTGSRNVHGFVIWAGEFASDIIEFKSNLKKIWQVFGSRDEFIAQELFDKQAQKIENKGFKIENVIFDGGHIIHEPSLKKVWSDLKTQH